MATLSQVIKYLNPVAQANDDYVLCDKGSGPEVVLWRLPGEPPTQEEVDALENDKGFQAWLEGKPQRIAEIENAVDHPEKESVHARRLLYDVQLDMVNEAVDSFNEVFQALGLQKRLDHYTRDDITARVKAKARQQ